MLPPFLYDWEDADLEPGQSMPNLEDLMRDSKIMEDQQFPGPTAEKSQLQYDEAQQWIASMFEDLKDHMTLDLTNQEKEDRRPTTGDRRPQGRTNQDTPLVKL